jgi:hypothetical protein
MIVGLDIDGVLADFITPFLQLLAERTGSGPIDPASVIDPNFTAHPFLTPTMIFDCLEAASYDAEAVVFMPHRSYNQAFDHPKVRRIQQLEELFEYLADK